MLEEPPDHFSGVISVVLGGNQIVFRAIQGILQWDSPNLGRGKHPVRLEGGVDPVEVFYAYIAQLGDVLGDDLQLGYKSGLLAVTEKTVCLNISGTDPFPDGIIVQTGYNLSS